MSDIQKIVQDLKNNLRYQEQHLGLTGVAGEKTGKKTVENPISNANETLEDIRKDIGDCKRCRLCEQRTNIVFGVGNSKTELMFVGEGPGRDEDKQGEPFVGRAGQLLNKIIEAMGMKREDVYIGNIVKCRPPENRAPLPDEVATCIPFLERQIAVIKPKIIVCLGSVAMQFLLRTERKISTVRGVWQEYQGIKVMPTYHPAFLLRNPNMKRPVWEDMQEVMKYLKKSN